LAKTFSCATILESIIVSYEEVGGRGRGNVCGGGMGGRRVVPVIES